MKRAHVIYGTVALALVVANALRWLPSQPAQAALPPAHARPLAPRDLELHVGAIAAELKPVARDLFQERAAPAARPVKRAAARPAGPPPKSAEQLAMEQAQAEFDSIKVIAIVFQDGVGQAFVSLGADSRIVGVGDALSERFRVEAIEVDGVQLRALDGTVDGRIALTGS